MVTIQKLLEFVVAKNASDLHLLVGFHPTVRIDSMLKPITDVPVLGPQEVERFVYDLLTPEQKDLLLANREIDFSFALGSLARFRVNVYYQRGWLAAALRLIPIKIRSFDELGLPAVLRTLTKLRQGFVLVTGPSGHGKSTTLAAMIQEINMTRAEHILTIEDPIEYIYPQGKSVVSQREMHLDTHSWEIALRSAPREDPNIVLVGEMRDYETISNAITIAETGHLTFATLHTNSAAQSVDRIIDVFPEHEQAQIRMQLSNALEAIISQRLIPHSGGGRLAVAEILIATPAVRTVVREGKTHLIDNIIQTSAELGMVSLEASLAKAVKEGKILAETALEYTLRPEELGRLLGRRARHEQE